MKTNLKVFKIIKLFKEINVELPLDDNVNIFLGENGLGKTTILNCLYGALSCDFEKLKDIIFDKIILEFMDGEKTEISHDDVEIYHSYSSYKTINKRDILRFNDTHEKTHYNYINSYNEIIFSKIMLRKVEIKKHIINAENFKETKNKKISKNILYFPTYRRIEEDMSKLGIDINNEEITSQQLIRFGMNDVENNIESLLQQIKSVAITSFAKMTAILLKQYLSSNIEINKSVVIEKNKLIIALARVGDEIEQKDKSQIIQLVSSKKIYTNKYLLNLIKNLIDSYEKQKPYDNKIKSFVNTCNKYLIGKSFIYDEKNVSLNIIRNNTNEVISLHHLSSGEKQIISVFSKLYIENNDDCVILFDEPELSLSLKWQNMFLPDIMRTSKCSKLIAVTHSPFIFENNLDKYARYMGSFLKQI